MGRPKKTVPPVRVGFVLPQDLAARVDAHLRSDIEDRVPHGVKSSFFEGLVRKFFQELDGEMSEIQTSLEIL